MKLRIVGLLLLMLSLHGCIVAGPEYPAYESGPYAYTYYPEWGVYYYPEREIWYWNEGGDWRTGRALPPSYPQGQMSSGVSIRLDSERPYTRHDYVVRRYGGPGRADHPGRPDRDHDRGHDHD